MAHQRHFAEARLAALGTSANHDNPDAIGVSNRPANFRDVHIATPRQRFTIARDNIDQGLSARISPARDFCARSSNRETFLSAVNSRLTLGKDWRLLTACFDSARVLSSAGSLAGSQSASSGLRSTIALRSTDVKGGREIRPLWRSKNRPVWRRSSGFRGTAGTEPEGALQGDLRRSGRRPTKTGASGGWVSRKSEIVSFDFV